ncbi:MAG: hypothetical protein ACI85O_003414 [Saprospiraceae bacterium]|jgi:hypothetical protein
MNNLFEKYGGELYWYCTDFCINAANLLGISYVEFNFILFLIIFPLVTIIMILGNLRLFVKSFRLKNK